MENNAKLKLIINYLDKSAEINLDNNGSFEQAKVNVANKFNISDKDKDNIFIKFFDIKYEQLSSQENCQLKLELFNYENSKEAVELKKEIVSFNEELKSINEQYEKSIKQIQDNFKSFKENIIKQNNENFDVVKDEIRGFISNNKKEQENINNNLDVDKNSKIPKLISQIREEIREIKENKNNNDNNDKEEFNKNEIYKLNENFDIEDNNNNICFYGTFEKFKETYEINNLEINIEEIKKIFEKNNNDFFDTMSELITESYKNLEKSK